MQPLYTKIYTHYKCVNILPFFSQKGVILNNGKHVSGTLRSYNETVCMFLNTIRQKETNFSKHLSFVEMNKGKQNFCLL